MNQVARGGAKIALGLWVGVSIVVGGALEARHVLALPVPIAAGHAGELTAQLLASAPEHYVAWHILLASCPCSRRVAAHLAERSAIDDVRDVIVWIDSDGVHPAPASTIAVQTVTPEVLHERFGAIAAPLLVVASRDGDVRYSGGYARHKQGAIEDEAILAAVRRGDDAGVLPVFGCAVSAELRRLMDPLGIDALVKRD